MTPPLTRPTPVLFWVLALWFATTLVALPFAYRGGLIGLICSTAVVATSLLLIVAFIIGFVRVNFLDSTDPDGETESH